METPTKLGNIVKLVATAAKCENCNYRLRHTDKTGQRKWCKRCIEVYNRKESLTPERAAETILKLVEPLYFDAVLDNLDEDVHKKLLSLQNGQDVFMFGPVGTGKTYAMAAMIRHYICQGYSCIRINFDDFCVRVRSTMSPASKKTEWDLIEPLKNVDRLFIDDLGIRSKRETDFAYVTFYSLLNKRQERVLPTFISSNKDIAKLSKAFDARVASRLQTALIIEMNGTDRRLKGENIAPVAG